MSPLRIRRRGGEERRTTWPGKDSWLRAAVGLLTGAAVCLILLGYNFSPGRYSLRVGEQSPVLIRAPRMARYLDLEETERLRREAERRVPRQYIARPFAVPDAEKQVDLLCQGILDAKGTQAPEQALDKALPGLTQAASAWLLSVTAQEMEGLRQEARAIVRQVMSQDIREGTADLASARREAEKQARSQYPRAEVGEVLAGIAKRAVAPTSVFDPDATKAARAEARQRVQEVARTIEADDAIIFPGERVTRQHLGMLRALGLSAPGLDYRRFVSTVLIVGFIIALLTVQVRQRMRPVYQSPKLLLLVSLLVVVPLFLTNLLVLALPNVWMLMVPAAALVAAVLLSHTVGLAVALSLSLLVGLMGNAGLPATLLSLGSALAALSYVSHIWPVSRLRWIVGSVAVTNLLLVTAMGLLQARPLLSIAREAGMAGLLYSPAVAALAVGGIFLLQRPFGITTHLGLLELSNPQHPLLRRLQLEAPGTYFASLLVANLAEAAAERAGADALLARVGALYHDIGKLSRPAFFAENQALLGIDNVHDRLSSSLSGLVIMSHVKDGVELARRHRLPGGVVDIIEQHHGKTLVSFFYHRALARERPESVSEEQYRYPGPLPRTKEAALVMLADSLQAATQSLPDPTPQRVQQMVRDIIRDRVVGGQLEECDLTFRDIITVEETATRILTALVCHTRVEYPWPGAPEALTPGPTVALEGPSKGREE